MSPVGQVRPEQQPVAAPITKTAEPGILAWYFFRQGIFGGLVWQTSEKPRIFAGWVGQRAGILSAIIPELWRSTFYHPPENVGKTHEISRHGVEASVRIYGGVLLPQRPETPQADFGFLNINKRTVVDWKKRPVP